MEKLQQSIEQLKKGGAEADGSQDEVEQRLGPVFIRFLDDSRLVDLCVFVLQCYDNELSNLGT